jgi:hypothetical protein
MMSIHVILGPDKPVGGVTVRHWPRRSGPALTHRAGSPGLLERVTEGERNRIRTCGFSGYFSPTRVVALLISEIALIFGFYFAAAYVTTEAPNLFLFEDAGLYRIGLVTLCIVGGFYLSDLYSQLRLRSKTRLLQQMCFVLGIAFLIQSLLDYLRLQEWALPKWMMIYGSVVVLLVLPVWRVLYDIVVMRRLARETVLFLGASPVARMVAERLAESPHFGLGVAGYLEDSPASDDLPDGPSARPHPPTAGSCGGVEAAAHYRRDDGTPRAPAGARSARIALFGDPY